MKVRTSFVSNSSSSSFVINKHFLSPDLIDKIKNHIQESKKLDALHKNESYIDKEGDEILSWESFYAKSCDSWNITEDDVNIRGFTVIDNFNMYRFLEEIGIMPERIKRED